ncbi:hypothetical protein HB904_03985 [Listeria booriae]|uniref:YopX protein domain-containing protein n=1 Tax=Listeria booriae TaxID=1552123 RepID=A0A842AFJ1_9LIST|nr:YopX family protein [Listeria booriae]MBC1615332.1 hypothetical protein [Listeria booriae]
MNQKLKLRGKSTETGEWVYGDLIQFPDTPASFIIKQKDGPSSFTYAQLVINNMVSVYPETVGQFTTLPDQNGKKIWDGDIVRIDNLAVFNLTSNYNDTPARGSCISEVKIIEGHTYVWLTPIIDGKKIRYGARLLLKGLPKYISRNVATGSVEVIGNIHDNPELLEEGAEE